ncbi:MAG: imidazole glycerol phosphate synthase subunit HisH [Candidatus Omnitrophica bacterium]|nr:imidazole glycerol phosphate synthase subunit HisH [Candidatus Omnitrophota bacterium]
MISIVDYGMGNLRSVQKALEKVGATAIVTDNPDIISTSEKIVLPGVGAIAPAMDKLKSLKLIEIIKNAIKNGKPFLGICLGLQLLFDQSDEGGTVETLGIIPGSVVRFTDLKIPHMGWNQLNIKQKNCPLFKGIEENSNAYFCHSFFVKPKNNEVSATTTNYGLDFTSSISKNNIFGVQFHPEKSQEIGLKILKNFNELK